MSADGILRGLPKDLAKVAKRLRREGWTVEQTSGCHVRWTCPCGGSELTGLTPSRSGLHQAVRRLSRHRCTDAA